MIIFSLGLPSAFTTWCDALTLDLARRAWGHAELVAADTLDEMALQMVGSPASHFVVSARQPSARLREVLREKNCRFVMSLGDSTAVVAEIMTTRALTITNAVRDVSSSVAAVTRYASLPGALIVGEQGEAQSAIDIARAIDRHFGFSLQEADIAAAAQLELPADAGDIDPEAWWHSLPADDQAVVRGALEPFGDYAATGKIAQITWERSLLFLADKSGLPATEAVDITGRARCLLYGPYIVLPPGSWTAHIVLVCSREAVGMSIFVEVTTGPVSVGKAHVPLAQAGIHEAVIDFVVGETAEGSVEVRIFNERAAFDGMLGLGRIVLLSRPPIVGDHRANVAAELGIDVG